MANHLVERVSEILRTYKSPAGAAKAVYAECRLYAAQAGMKPDVEVQIYKPGEDRFSGQTKCWAVCFEAGPYEWAVEASMAGGKVHAEPYYSFDLHFYPG